MSRKRTRKILFIAEGIVIAVLLIILLLTLHRSREKSSASAEEGRAYIAAEEARDPAQAMSVIRQAREAAENAESDAESEGSATEGTFIPEELASQIAELNIPDLSPEEIAMLRQRLNTTVFVGDSMAQAILEYELLDENHVRYQRSASISQLYDLTQEALAMLPDRIIFFTGLNDVDVFEDPQDYYYAYLERIGQVQAADPDIRIYVCSLLPPSDELAGWREDLARSPLYDEQLQRVCDDTAAQYIDAKWMVRQELYLEDGIHFNYSFYTVLLKYIAQVIGV